jgi:hypothetical protein
MTKGGEEEKGSISVRVRVTLRTSHNAVLSNTVLPLQSPALEAGQCIRLKSAPVQFSVRSLLFSCFNSVPVTLCSCNFVKPLYAEGE